MAAQGAPPATMRLRVRPSTGGPTIKLQVPLLCTLQGLKDLLSPQAAVPANSLAVSLNKEDEIQGPGGALLSSLGITSGDLLFYSVVSHRHASPPIREPPPRPFARGDEAEEGAPERNRERVAAAAEARRSLGLAGAERRGRASGANAISRRVAELDGETPGGVIPMEEQEDLPHAGRIDHPPSSSGVGGGDVEGMIIGGDGAELFGLVGAGYREDEELRSLSHERLPNSEWLPRSDVLKSESFQARPSQIMKTGGGMHAVTQLDDESGLSLQHAAGCNTMREGGGAMVVPDFFCRVLACELGNVRKQSDYLILAVHAIMLDTGFTIRVGSHEHKDKDESTVSGGSPPLAGVSEGYALHPGWSDAAGSTNFAYVLSSSARRKGRETLLPNSLLAMSTDTEEEVVLLRCQVVGDFVIIYGLVNGGSTNRLCLSVTKYLHKRSDLYTSTEKIGDSKDGSNRIGENVLCNIPELWREVKDNLSLRLLTSLCEKIGIPPPPSLVRLPTELKAKVLDCLHPVDLARLSCVCSEFRVLSSNDELWKQKYKELFGAADASRIPIRSGWRTAFVKEFERRRNDRRAVERIFRNEGSFAAGRRYRRNPTIAPHFGAGIDRYFHRANGEGTRDSGAFGAMFGTNFLNPGGGDHVGLPGFGCGYNFGRRRPRNLGSSTMFSNHLLRPYGDGVCLPLHEMPSSNSSVMQPLSWPPPSTTTDGTMPMAGGARIHQIDTINTQPLDYVYGGMSSLNTTGAGMGYGGLPTSGGPGSLNGRGVPNGNIEYNGRHAVPGAAVPQDGWHLASSRSSSGV